MGMDILGWLAAITCMENSRMEQYTLHPLSPRDVSTIMQLCTLYCTVTGWLEALAQSTFYNTTSSQADNTLFLSGGVCSKYTLPYQYRPRMYCSCLEGLAQSTLPYHHRPTILCFYMVLPKVHLTIPTQAKNTVFIWRGLPKVHLTRSSQDDDALFSSGGACPKYILPYQHRTKIHSFPLEGLAQSTSYHYQHWPKIQFSSGGACSKYILPYQHWLKIQF